jgi:hypothetical protein
MTPSRMTLGKTVNVAMYLKCVVNVYIYIHYMYSISRVSVKYMFSLYTVQICAVYVKQMDSICTVYEQYMNSI